MPILHELTGHKDGNPDDLPQSVIVYGLSMAAQHLELAHHSHRKAQLLLSMRGVLTAEVESGLWLVPPQCAIWIPSDARHAIKASGMIEGYNAFIDPAMAARLPADCCTVAVSPLLRELMIRAAGFPLGHPEGGHETQVNALLLEELATSPVQQLHLPMPDDARLRRLAQLMIADPADRATASTWAARIGLSERTLARILLVQTGISFGRWRQQLMVMLALQWMADGASIQRVAGNLGYESAGSFVTMFRKTLGTSPARYMALKDGKAMPRRAA